MSNEIGPIELTKSGRVAISKFPAFFTDNSIQTAGHANWNDNGNIDLKSSSRSSSDIQSDSSDDSVKVENSSIIELRSDVISLKSESESSSCHEVVIHIDDDEIINLTDSCSDSTTPVVDRPNLSSKDNNCPKDRPEDSTIESICSLAGTDSYRNRWET